MPKRTRLRSRTSSQVSTKVEEADEPGHTPKWTRSSSSPSPEPHSTDETQSVEEAVTNSQEMQCILPGHPPLIIASIAEFESHYAKDHTNQCVACKANLPSPWMLELHHLESHDPLVAAKRDNGEKTYQCFLQDCEKVTLTPQKRRLHLIDKHGFPRNYNFTLINSGLKGGRSLLQEAKASAKKSKEESKAKISDVEDKTSDVSNQQANTVPQGSSYSKQLQKDISKSSTSSSKPTSTLTQEQDTQISQGSDAAIDKLSSAMSSLVFVPMSVRMKNKKNS